MSSSLGRIALGLLGLTTTLLLFPIPADADATWPREIKTEHGILTVYQPQPEKFDGNVLTARAAVSLLKQGESEPTFGVFWYTARVDTDQDAGTSMVRNIVVTEVRWPDSKEEEQRKMAESLTALWRNTELPISLERLKASLATAEMEKKSVEGLNTNPPKIVVIEEVAELLCYDGEPRGVSIPNTELEQIANAPFAVIRDKSSGICYLSGGKIWYSAKDPKGPWAPIAKPPADILKLVPPDTSSIAAPAKPPKIVVATEPTELISTAGPPAWKPIGKGELLYIENTETPVIREVATNKVFVLISGRWYTAASLSGPWTIVRPDETPASFKDIPPQSDLGATRVSVAGTPEAEEAMLDAHVPQTAAIDRSKAKFEAKYDGAPQFKAIQGTAVEYATNTASQVLRIGGKYYACDNAVWFVSGAAEGPWAVADSVPTAEIKKIPPSEPVYNTTYVTVYESTPSVVYVGYTPGYMGSYPWYGVPVYGTGWYYPPYWGPNYYYPRPVTYGMHVGYNPWSGWSMGFSWSNGFMTVGIGFGGGYGGYYRPGYGYPHGGYYRPPGCYPPGGYRPPYHNPGYRPGGSPRPMPYASQGGGGRGGVGGGGAGVSQRPANNNLYGQGAAKDRMAPSTMQRDAGMAKADRVAKGPNNVYADKSGNVHRQTSGGWQSRDQGTWKNSSPSPSTRPSQGSSPSARPSTRPSQAPSSVNRDYQARQNGANRSSQMSQSRGGGSRGGGSSGGGGRGGGGGRRR